MGAVWDDLADGEVARLPRLLEHLDVVQRMAGLGTWELDVSDGRLRWSPHLDAVLGWSPPEVATFDHLLEVVHPADRDRVAEVHDGAVRAVTGYEVEHRIVRGDDVRRVRQDVVVEPHDGAGVRLLGTVLDVTDRAAQARQLLEVESRRRELLHRLVQASEGARSRLAGDLHDGPVQVLTATAMRLEVLARTEADPPPWLDRALPLVRGVCTELREVLLDLHPQVVGVDLRDTVAHLANLVLPGTPVTTAVHGGEPPAGAARAVHGLVQEAFWDVREHDSADAITVDVTVRDGTVVVVDGGPGHVPLLTRVGLFAVRERCEAVGGTATLDHDHRVLCCTLPTEPATAA